MKILFNFIAATVLGMSVVWLTGCPSSSSSESTPSSFGETPTTDIPPYDPAINGSALYCNSTPVYLEGDTNLEAPPAPSEDPEASGIPRWNISKTPDEPNIANNVKRLSIAVKPMTPGGDTYQTTDPEAANYLDLGDDTLVHPMVVSYAGQVIGDYTLGEGSADIGDPDNIDEIFVALSLDNGKTWKDVQISDSAIKSSIQVSWDTDHDGTRETINYPGHSHKPTMAVQTLKDIDGVDHHYLLVGWLDKYCPSGDPFGLDDGDIIYQDYFKVNGNHGSIDYNLPCTITDPEALDYDCAPNGQAVYEVPFSCVWTARGEFLQETDTEGNPVVNDTGDPVYTIEWRQPVQLTSGTRDANKIWFATSEAGAAVTWQEDPVGLRAGKGAGPGVGWSGATTNHGADIWFTKINKDDFGTVVTVDENGDPVDPSLKPKSLVNFDYPVRITDNEKCNGDGDTKPYCAHICDGAESTDCVTEYIDMLSLSTLSEDGVYYSVLDGDTGASRPAMKILKTDLEELVVVLGYEETKGLAITDPGVPSPDQGVVDPTDTIADEGKSVYFESFVLPIEPVMDLPVDGDDAVPTFRTPVVSAGYIVNQLVNEVQVGEDEIPVETGELVYENARRLVIMTHVDNCEADEAGATYTFGFMYKQGIYTRGGPSDMYIRLNTGFNYLDDNNDPLFEDALNISSHEVELDPDGNYTDGVIWEPAYMTDHESHTILMDNTFSPRGWLRGIDVFTAFEYTPHWDESTHGCLPNKFHFNGTTDGAWVNGPIIISKVRGPCVSTLDPRIKAAPKGKQTDGIVSDLGNKDAIFMVYGTYDINTGEELDLFYTWSDDRGATWDVLTDDADPDYEANRKLAARTGLQEKEAQIIASPDGSMLWTVWNQEYEHEEHVIVPYDPEHPDHFLGLDSWTGRVDYELVPEVE